MSHLTPPPLQKAISDLEAIRSTPHPFASAILWLALAHVMEGSPSAADEALDDATSDEGGVIPSLRAFIAALAAAQRAIVGDLFATVAALQEVSFIFTF
jgi:hypothetical protein